MNLKDSLQIPRSSGFIVSTHDGIGAIGDGGKVAEFRIHQASEAVGILQEEHPQRKIQPGKGLNLIEAGSDKFHRHQVGNLLHQLLIGFRTKALSGAEGIVVVHERIVREVAAHRAEEIQGLAVRHRTPVGERDLKISDTQLPCQPDARFDLRHGHGDHAHHRDHIRIVLHFVHKLRDDLQVLAPVYGIALTGGAKEVNAAGTILAQQAHALAKQRHIQLIILGPGNAGRAEQKSRETLFHRGYLHYI